MNIEEIKQIKITDLLAHLGHNPVAKTKGGRQWLYKSPFRQERTASFSVSTTKNIWRDFGDSKGGNIIDLAIELRGNCTLHSALLWLEDQYNAFGSGVPVGDNLIKKSYLNPKRPDESDIRDVRIEPLTHRALLSYLMSRSIPVDIGTRYCKEVHYTIYSKEYFGLCFMNILGGMEIRNPYFKGCHGVKAPSIISVEKEKRTEYCYVFEGFMDFLSYQALFIKGDKVITQDTPCDCIVLNSTSIVQKAIPFMDVYSRVYCYLDNDKAGDNALAEIKQVLGAKVYYMGNLYCDYNDLNDYLKHRITTEL